MLEKFAADYRVTIRRNREDDTDNIDGRFGTIYEYSQTELAVMFIPKLKPGQAARTGMWNARRTEAEAAGMTLRQSGDAEGTLSFDPINQKHSQIALKIARPKQKRRLSPSQLAHLARIGFQSHGSGADFGLESISVARTNLLPSEDVPTHSGP